MKFFAASLSLAAVLGSVAAAPVESDVLAKARAVFARNSPMASALREQTLAKRNNGPTDVDILNFALQLEYLEAQYYQHAVNGKGLDGSLLSGTGNRGGVSGGKKVNFKNKVIRQFAKEIAQDELNHVKDLRAALGANAVAQPAINIGSSFTAAAVAAGIIKKGQTFSPYAGDAEFLIGAFLFEDTGVTAYNGAAPLISSKDYLAAAASILAVEAYHAGTVRSTLFTLGSKNKKSHSIIEIVNKAAKAIGAVDSGKSQGIEVDGTANIVPTDSGSLAFARTPGQVVDIVYLTGTAGATSGGFFPKGLNGYFTTAAGAGN